MKRTMIPAVVVLGLLCTEAAQAAPTGSAWTVQLVPISSAGEVLEKPASDFDGRKGTITRTVRAGDSPTSIDAMRVSYVGGFDAAGRPVNAHVDTGLTIGIDDGEGRTLTVRRVTIGTPVILDAGVTGAMLVPATRESTLTGTLSAGDKDDVDTGFRMVGTIGGIDQPAYLIRARRD